MDFFINDIKFSYRTDTVSGLTTDDCIYLYNFISNKNIFNVLEIGMADGMSTIAIMKSLLENSNKMNKAISLTSIDPYQKKYWNNNGVNNLKKFNIDEFHTLIEVPDYLALPKLIEEGKKYDLIFIDGQHTFDHVLLNNFYADILLNKTGHIINDDFWMPSIKKVHEYISNNYNHFEISDEKYDRFGPIYKKIANKNIPWNSFTNF
jgi:predicted O-methyltransferase YrrM